MELPYRESDVSEYSTVTAMKSAYEVPKGSSSGKMGGKERESGTERKEELRCVCQRRHQTEKRFTR